MSSWIAEGKLCYNNPESSCMVVFTCALALVIYVQSTVHGHVTFIILFFSGLPPLNPGRWEKSEYLKSRKHGLLQEVSMTQVEQNNVREGEREGGRERERERERVLQQL